MTSRVALLIALLAMFPGIARAQNLSPVLNTDLLARTYGITAPPVIVEADVTVGTAATKILNLDAGRVEDVVVDTGTSNCSIAHNNAVTMTQGTLLLSGGGIASENFRDDLTLPTGELYAICGAAGGTIHLLTVKLQ